MAKNVDYVGHSALAPMLFTCGIASGLVSAALWGLSAFIGWMQSQDGLFVQHLPVIDIGVFSPWVVAFIVCAVVLIIAAVVLWRYPFTVRRLYGARGVDRSKALEIARRWKKDIPNAFKPVVFDEVEQLPGLKSIRPTAGGGGLLIKMRLPHGAVDWDGVLEKTCPRLVQVWNVHTVKPLRIGADWAELEVAASDHMREARSAVI